MRRLGPILILMLFAIPAVASPADCNVIVSMSQGKQVYMGQADGVVQVSPLEALTGEQWMLLYAPGKLLAWWTVSTNWDVLAERHRCGSDAEIDRVLFIFDPAGSDLFTDDLALAIGVMGSRFPNAEIDVSLLVGGVGHVVCVVEGQNVAASIKHMNAIGAMTMPEAGPDLDVTCSGYEDRKGHLSDSGAMDALRQVASFYE